MAIDIFQDRALRTWVSIVPDVDYELLHAVMGLAGEGGELAGELNKMYFKPGYGYSKEKLLKELGDVFYYLVVTAYLLGVTVEELSVDNRAKLEGGKHGWAERSLE